MTQTFLHVGCGGKRRDQTTRGFAGAGWRELRLDIDPAVQPDIVGTMTDMAGVADASVDAVYSSHNIEHLYPHEVPAALREFRRVLKPTGFVVITCPDLQSVCAEVARDRLTDAMYQSPAGPIAPIDMLYGFRPALAKGNHFMAHRCGFTARVLAATVRQAGFGATAVRARPGPHYDLWLVGSVQPLSEAGMKVLAAGHVPA